MDNQQSPPPQARAGVHQPTPDAALSPRPDGNPGDGRSGAADEVPGAKPYRKGLRRVIQFVAVVSWLAFAAAFMPEKWFIEVSEFLQLSAFPQTSLGFYLARHLSLIYGFVGVLLWVLANDLDRYLPLVRKISRMTIVFGGLQLMMDFASNMPLWWTFTESLSTIAGGVLLLAMSSPTKRHPNKTNLQR